MLDNTNIVPGEYRDIDNNKFVFDNNQLLIEIYYDTGDILDYKYIWKKNKFMNETYNDFFEIEYCDKDSVLLITNDSMWITLHKNLKD